MTPSAAAGSTCSSSSKSNPLPHPTMTSSSTGSNAGTSSNITATSLVEALLSFGAQDEVDQTRTQLGSQPDHDQEHDHNQDQDRDELSVVGSSSTSSAKEEPKQTPSDLSTSLQQLKLASTSTAASPSTATPKSIRNLLHSSLHTVHTSDPSTTHHITSWKMADYAYKRDPCPFPTRARGLFTENVDPNGTSRAGEQYRIVARGYDKFFNVGEVSWTEWTNIPKQSTAPYELTLKSNGCIIFIAALTPRHILVTSKHSIGPLPAFNSTNAEGRDEEEERISHSQRGEYWLKRHLEKVGKTQEMLAQELWSHNLTAVAELCDDSFEEHVLAYPTHLTGLHLHGLNLNEPILQTLPSSYVTLFAQKWGFIPTPYTLFPSVMAVQTYCQTVQSLGGIEQPNGKIVPVEGFVIRGVQRGGVSRMVEFMDEDGVKRLEKANEAFFWKVKYDEPYLMYREWRELTRKLLMMYEKEREARSTVVGAGAGAGRKGREDPIVLDNVNLNKVKNEQTKLYLWWIKREIEKDYTKFESWKKGRGIIKTREEFLKWRNGDEAKVVVKSLAKGKNRMGLLGKEEEEVDEEEARREYDRWLIAPVAVQGCGKTALGLALSDLFGFAHIQSDDFHMKKSGPHFLKAVKAALQADQVVYADKNNHQIKLRSDLSSLALSLSPSHKVQTIALLYSIDSPTLQRDKLHALCSSRIVERGDRHQTLRAGLLHEAAIWQFLGQWEAFDPVLNPGDGAFDVVVQMKAEWGREEAIREVVKALKRVGVPGCKELAGEGEVDEGKLKKAVERGMTWEPKIKKAVDEVKVKKEKIAVRKTKEANLPPRYFGVAFKVELEGLVEKAFEGREVEVWTELKRVKRVELNPHITLVHEKEVQLVEGGNPEMTAEKKKHWERFANHLKGKEEDDEALKVKVVLGPKIVWDSRVLSVQVSSIVPSSTEAKDGSVLDLDGCLGKDPVAHLTVGTIRSDVRPVEGKWILDGWIEGEKQTKEGGDINFIEIEPVECEGTLAGLR
ncbi:BZ3500_MvSof-1268-A1-R1_Chr4-3g07285 [Microbotryum saponariae]|uniref:BZ3500_MvSof-1268-A1-R1_Chr4-3g07285 protein n=1 Tax=Microbotryum saponariae TaxID=289078 RepID=A0A2X0LNR6_9BASI|nr:BZ3500_MvSof-1268-A1-R1_Chr4-3g07285 [Microbotryum saponariae]SDA06948.1 BZ3501_MvSof-1269-A2-R1_Chr4-2g06994 [Microbotryum saponariae]